MKIKTRPKFRYKTPYNTTVKIILLIKKPLKVFLTKLTKIIYFFKS